jgi:hypothetical protein
VAPVDSKADQSAGKVSEIIANIREDVKAMVQGEVELAKAELVPAAKSAGIGAGLFAGAGYFAISALSLLFTAAALGIYAAGLPLWLSFLIMGVGLLLIAGLLGAVGLVSVKKVKAPEQTISEAQRTVVALKGAVARGTAAAKAPQIEGHVER